MNYNLRLKELKWHWIFEMHKHYYCQNPHIHNFLNNKTKKKRGGGISSGLMPVKKLQGNQICKDFSLNITYKYINLWAFIFNTLYLLCFIHVPVCLQTRDTYIETTYVNIPCLAYKFKNLTSHQNSLVLDVYQYHFVLIWKNEINKNVMNCKVHWGFDWSIASGKKTQIQKIVQSIIVIAAF